MKSERTVDCRGISPTRRADLRAEGYHPAPRAQSVRDSLVTHCLLQASHLCQLPVGVTGKTLSILGTLCPSVQRNVPVVSPWACAAGFYQSRAPSHCCWGLGPKMSVGLTVFVVKGRTLVTEQEGKGTSVC